MENIYFDELYFFQKKIKENKNNFYLNILSIIHNPNSKNPKELFNIYKNKQELKNELDLAGLENLKQKLSNGKGFVVK